MCGLSGFHGVRGEHTKLMLTIGLAAGIDNRGGDASGYVSISEDGLRYARKCGEWIKSRMRFIQGAAMGNICMMHARYATCGSKGATSAHPFAIRREGKIVLWGAHNGMIPSAWSSAKSHGRDVDVDSQELFELIADKDYEGIGKMNGYGVANWIEAEDPTCVKVARLTKNSEFCLASLKEGGMAWASTWKILGEALESAKLTAKHTFDLEDVGRVYEIREDTVYRTAEDGVKLGAHDSWATSYRSTSAFSSMYEYENDDEWRKEDIGGRGGSGTLGL